MLKSTSIRLLVLISTVWLGVPRASADELPLVREILVPFDDLNVLLEGDAERVFMTREQYDDLLNRARRTPQEARPYHAALLAGRYEGTIEAGHARLTGELTIDVLADGLHALPLELSGVALLRATLDDRPASLGRGNPQPVLFVEGIGRHTLTLEMFVPLQRAAALQTLHFQLPTPPAAQLQLTVPGNVEIKSGAEVVTRSVNEQQDNTHLSLVLRPGPISLVMTLNNRLLRTSQVVVARGVLVDEVTAAYERLHASVSLGVLHGAVDRFRFAVPEGFEVTEVAAPLLTQWAVSEVDGRHVLETRLSEPATDTVVVNITATATPARLEEWTFPRLEALDTVGQAAIVGVLLDERWKAENIRQQRLIPIDNAVLAAALPASVFTAEPGAPRIQPVVAYYAPQNDFELAARFAKPPARLNVTTNLLLTLDDKQHHVRGSFALLPNSDKLFQAAIKLPPEWSITEVTDANGHAIPFERYGDGNQSRVDVRFPHGILPGQTYNLFFQAVHTPGDWLTLWTAKEVEFPRFAVQDATHDVGAIAVRGLDGMQVRPQTLELLTPLDEDEKGKYGLGGVPTDLLYRYDAGEYRASLTVERKTPRITAQAYSFLTIESGGLQGHYEIVYDIAEARASRLRFRLPASTPAAISIRGLDGVAVGQTAAEELGAERFWTAHLAERRRGRVRLAIDFQQRLDMAERAEQGMSREIDLPVIAADSVAYQTGLVAVEGSADLAIDITRHPRRVDIGELVDAQYQPGRRLLGSFGYVGAPPQVQASVTRQPGHLLPGAIVQRAEMVSLMSASGMTQTAARYQLRTKLPFVEIELPAGSQLWSTQLDGQPGQPQQRADRLLVSLPPAEDSTLRDLQIVFETSVDRLSLRGTIELTAPKLYLREIADSIAQEVPVAELKWHLYLPSGYRISKSSGTVFTDEITPPETPLAMAGALLGALASDVTLAMPGQAARESGTVASIAPDRDVASKLAPVTGPEMESPADQAAATPPPAALPPGEPSPAATPQTKAAAKEPEKATIGVAETAKQNLGVADARKSSSLWALEGVRSLKIDLQQRGRQVRFESLGVDPRINATLTNEHRLAMLAWAVALFLVLMGLSLSSSSLRTKVRFVSGVLIVSSLLPVLGDWFVELTPVCELTFLTGCVLAVYYLAVAMARFTAGRFRGWPLERHAAAAALALLCLTTNAAHAQPAALPHPPRNGNTLLADLGRLLQPVNPVVLPKNAVIIPYDATKPLGEDATGQLLVPYETYVELWNRAHPDKRIVDKPPPASYGVAGTRYEATLEEGDALSLTGVLDIDLYGEGAIAIPLQLEGGVLTSAKLDGKPALLRAGDPNVPLAAAKPANAQDVVAPSGRALVLYAEGKGRKRLEISLRFKLQRRGGWYVATGRLPAGPATQLTLNVPQSGVEVRLDKLADQGAYETRQPNETIETALGHGGVLNLQWRTKVAQAQVDRSLTADSNAVLDVREDGLRLHWRLKLQFRGSQRDSFTLDAPSDYFVERITGANVRGWTSKSADERQQIEVTLLKAVADQEEIGLELSRRMPLATGETTEILAPVVVVTSAVLHQGRLAVRRSPLLELRSLEASGLSRADAPMEELATMASHDTSPLGLRPFQAFQFVHTPFTLRLSVSEIRTSVKATVQALLRVTEREPTLEAHLRLRPEGRPLYQVRMQLPQGFQLDRVVAPGVHHWSVREEDSGQVLSIYLASGQASEFSVVVAGRLPALDENRSLLLPKLILLDATAQEGQIVAQADPAYDLRATDLENTASVLMAATHGWLQPEQRAAARLALAYQSADYAGRLSIVPRQPQVRALAISNTKVTSRTIEETILLELTIHEAGIRQMSFIVPKTLEQARVSAPLLRRKTIEPLAGADDSQVRVRLEFQDEIMGQLRVLVEHDRLLSGDQQSAPIPFVETGVTTDRYVTLESAGNDEVIADQSPGLDPLSRQQSEWRTLSNLLGTGLTQAFLVRDGAEKPRFTYRIRTREALETVGARIGLAEAVLMVDPYGAYRGAMDYHVENTTEPFLDVRLPSGAELWTVRVANEAVKPVRRHSAMPHVVSIPLIKTAVGDQDYRVSIKYGGRLPRLAIWRQIEFPLIRTVNINVELSQVRLRLPETYHWLNFGGSMRRAEDETELTTGFLSYRNRQIERLSQILSSAGGYSQARATSNLKQLQVELDQLQARQPAVNEELRSYYEANSAALAEGEKIAVQQLKSAETTMFDNRQRLSDLYGAQQTSRSKNVITQLEHNFRPGMDGSKTEAAAKNFEAEWVKNNQLEANRQPAQAAAGQRVRGIQDQQPTGQPQAAAAQPAAAGVAQGEAKDMLERQAGQGEGLGGSQRDDDSRSQLRRYQQRLEENAPSRAAFAAQPPGMADGPSGGAPFPMLQGQASVGRFNVTNGIGIAAPTEAAPSVALASLDVELPALGPGYREVLFTTPRGDVEITARPLSEETTHRLTRLAAVLGAVLLAWLTARGAALYGARLLSSRLIAAALIVAGLAGILSCLLPLLGIVSLLAGLSLLAWQYLASRRLSVT